MNYVVVIWLAMCATQKRKSTWDFKRIRNSEVQLPYGKFREYKKKKKNIITLLLVGVQAHCCCRATFSARVC